MDRSNYSRTERCWEIETRRRRGGSRLAGMPWNRPYKVTPSKGGEATKRPAQNENLALHFIITAKGFSGAGLKPGAIAGGYSSSCSRDRIYEMQDLANLDTPHL